MHIGRRAFTSSVLIIQATYLLAADLPVRGCKPQPIPSSPPGLLLRFAEDEDRLASHIRPSCFRDVIGDFNAIGPSTSFLLADGNTRICELDSQTIEDFHRPDGSLFEPLVEDDGFVSELLLRKVSQHIFLWKIQLNLGGSATLVRYVVGSIVVDQINSRQPQRSTMLVRVVLSPNILSDGDALSAARMLFR
jgi:hypothetical protein